MINLRRTSGVISVAGPRVLVPFSSQRHNSQTVSFPYTCDVDAEPLHHYRPGGYHPVHLGGQLKNRRYKILHKVGWGGYSTTWAARDRDLQRYVAIKISMAGSMSSNEASILQLISSSPCYTYRGKEHILLPRGTNGKHPCLVLELLGPSIPDLIDSYLHDERLPAQAARSIAYQVLTGVDFLAHLNISHGGVHKHAQSAQAWSSEANRQVCFKSTFAFLSHPTYTLRGKHVRVRRCELTTQDLDKISELARLLLRWEPARRSLARDIASDLWFHDSSTRISD
ncbi:hypothetical protein RRF57_011587 [Xylaria bambusicola]|uniref:non-specific serine/threonine protein kinase n=1 Tax=Xylaria bambusicola TaxID=326684 RepID=A0AAN7UN39_9PEZI